MWTPNCRALLRVGRDDSPAEPDLVFELELARETKDDVHLRTAVKRFVEARARAGIDCRIEKGSQGGFVIRIDRKG